MDIAAVVVAVAVACLYNAVAFYGNVRYVLLTKRIKRLHKSVQQQGGRRERCRGGHGNGHGCEYHDTYEHFCDRQTKAEAVAKSVALALAETQFKLLL